MAVLNSSSSGELGHSHQHKLKALVSWAQARPNFCSSLLHFFLVQWKSYPEHTPQVTTVVFSISFLIVFSRFIAIMVLMWPTTNTSTAERRGGTKVHTTSVLSVDTVGVFGSGVEAQGVVVLFLSWMPLGRKYLFVFVGVGCLAVLHRKISKEASQGLSSLSPVLY